MNTASATRLRECAECRNRPEFGLTQIKGVPLAG